MGGLHGACFKIIATYTTSFPITHIKAREKLTPRICLSSVTGKDGGFAFKGYNAEVKRVLICVPLVTHMSGEQPLPSTAMA